VARGTLECGLEWARHVFDEMILLATATRKLRVERAQVEMQLVVARAAAATAVVSEASARTSLGVAQQSAEVRVTTAQTAIAVVATERDSVDPRSRSSVRPRRLPRRPPRGPRPPPLPLKPPPGMLPKPLLVRRRRSRRGCRSWSGTWVRPGRTWRRPAACSLRSRTNSRWSPRRQRSCVRATPSCRRTLRVRRVVAVFLCFARCWPLVTF
jgi:hypothetical protein